jgi:hypothetical protein
VMMDFTSFVSWIVCFFLIHLPHGLWIWCFSHVVLI